MGSYNTKRGTDMVMAPGMIFTIEPMVNMGKADIYVDDKNNWKYTPMTDFHQPSGKSWYLSQRMDMRS